MKLLIGLILLGIFLLSSFDWRRSVKAVFFVILIEGALRKWVFPGASDILYFSRDLILAGAYLKYYCLSPFEKRFSIKHYSIKMLLLLVAGWCVFQVFNPSLGSPIVGILGLRAYLWYVPLMWMIPNLFQSEEELSKFLRSHLLLSIPIGVLGIVQFFSSPSSLINVYAAGAENDAAIATFGKGGYTITRITGTFPYIESYNLYLIVCFGLLISLVFSVKSQLWRKIYLVALLFVSVNSLMTGSRSVVFASILFVIGYLFIQKLRSSPSRIRLRQLLIPILVMSTIILIGFRPAANAFWSRTVSNNDLQMRIVHIVSQPFEFLKYTGFDGYGTGATHPGGRAVIRALSLPPSKQILASYEEEPERIVLELGPIGFAFWYLFKASILLALWRVSFQLTRPLLRQLALAAFLIQAIQYLDLLVFQNVFLLYYWFLSSFIFLLPRLERIENWQQIHKLNQQNV